MEGSSYRKFSISLEGSLVLVTELGFLLAGTWSVPLAGTRGSGSCLEAGGNDTGVWELKFTLSISAAYVPLSRIKPNVVQLVELDKRSNCLGEFIFRKNVHADFYGLSDIDSVVTDFDPNTEYFSILSSKSRNNLCTQVNWVAHSQQAPLRQDPIPLVLLAWVPLKRELILNPANLRVFDFASPFLLSGLLGFLFFLTKNLTRSLLFEPRSSFPQVILSLFPSLIPNLFRMTNGIDLAPGSSSIGIRVHSRCGVGNEARESMDLSDSSLDLTAEIEELRNAFTGEASPPPGGGIFSPVGPSSVIGVEEVANWKRKFHLPDEVTIRIPGPFDRVSDFELGEIPVYEGFFESGFRDRIPSLVAEVLKAVKISPGQLNPISWRTLIAIQNLGDLKGFTVGVVEVLYCYSISPLNGGEFRYHLHPRGKGLPVSELSKAERKCCPVFEGHWTSKFSFMSFPGFSPTWCAADTSRLDYSTGRDTIERLLELPLERREVSFLVSDEVLDQCSIRGAMSGSRGDEALR
ncbi:hypothetical protein YC2023_058875 [Brassica napus]